MKKIEVCETIKLYHLIEVDDEVDIEDTINQANINSTKFDTGREAIESVLEKLKNTYGFDYQIKPNYCGTEIEGLNIMDEVD